jgi:hypothetical protein
VPGSTKSLIAGILKSDQNKIYAVVRDYVRGGSVQFDKILSISLHGRVPNLTHVYGFEPIHKLLGAMLTSFNESLNLIRPMTAEQIFECSHEMVMTSEEDQLAIEDYVLFFKGAKEGRYGRILDRLDQQTIFAMLEEYRQERHRQFIRIKEEKHLAQKSQGPSERTNNPDPLAESLCNLTGRMSEMKEKLKEQREFNRMQKFNKEL